MKAERKRVQNKFHFKYLIKQHMYRGPNEIKWMKGWKRRASPAVDIFFTEWKDKDKEKGIELIK